MNPTLNAHNDLAYTALILCKADGDLLQAVEIAKHDLRGRGRTESILRSAVEAGSITDPNWASALGGDYSQAVQSFVDGLTSVSVFDAMLTGGARRVPLRTPLVVTTSVLGGSIVAAGSPKPVSVLALDPGGIAPRTAVVLTVVSQELLRFATNAAADMLNRELRNGVASATDASFLALLADNLPTGHALACSGNPLTDIREAALLVSTHGTGKLYWITDPTACTQMATQQTSDGALRFPQMTCSGGSISGVTVIPSDQLAAGLSLFVDANQIALDSETILLSASKYASLAQNSAPGAGAQSHVSMFQTNCVALRAERWFGAQRLRDSAVVVIDSTDYTGSPG